MAYRLVVSDLDGTLLASDHAMTDRTASACRNLMARGCLVTFATGRAWPGTLALAEALNLTVPVIAYQGAVARHHDGRPPLWHDTIPRDMAGEMLEWLHRRSARVSVCQGDEMLLSHAHERTIAFLESTGNRVRVVGRLRPELAQDPTRIAVFGEPPEILDWERHLRKAFPATVRIGRSLSHLCEITHPRASKGQAITRLADWLGIPMTAVVAIGDNYNDADMIATAGLGVAMSDAPADVLASAGRIILRSATEGIADFLDGLASQLP